MKQEMAPAPHILRRFDPNMAVHSVGPLTDDRQFIKQSSAVQFIFLE